MSKSTTEHALKALFGLISSRGRGVQRILTSALSVSEAVLTKLKGSSDIPLGRFVDLAYALGISPAPLLKVPGEGVLTAVFPIPRKNERKLTAIELAVEDALERGRGRLAQEHLAERLEAVDDMRYRSPLAALEQLEELGADITPDQTPYVLAVAASCFRMLAQHSYASRCLFRGRQLAERFGDRLAIGELYQRSVYFFDSLGYPAIALECAERATLVYTRLGHRRKIGESLVDQGFCYFQLKRYEDCLLVHTDAGRFHEYLFLRYRVTRLHGSASALYHLGRMDEALAFTRRATAEGLAGSPTLKAKVLWTEGAALGAQGIDRIEDAIELLLDSLPVDAALASVDLCKSYLSAKRFDDAYRVARGMSVFVMAFHHVPAVGQALLELILIGQATRGLTVTLLEKAAKTIRENRARYYQHARLRSL